MAPEGNIGLELVLPITLGVILLVLIILLVLFLLATTGKGSLSDEVLEDSREINQQNTKVQLKSDERKTRSIAGQRATNRKQMSTNLPEIRLFPDKKFPGKVICGMLQGGDVYYEEQTRYQAGRRSREALELVTLCRLEKNTPDADSLGSLSEETKREMKENVYSNSVGRDNDWSEGKFGGKNRASPGVIDHPVGPEIENTESNKADKRKTFVAMYPLKSSSRDELNLLANDVIFYLGEGSNGWLKGEKKGTGEVGWFPISYVREGVSQAPDTAMFESELADDNFSDDDEDIFECVVKHDYQATHDGDLTLRKGDLVHVRQTLENGWWKGECRGVQGFFPGSYVQRTWEAPATTKSSVDLSDRAPSRAAPDYYEKRNSLGRQFIIKLSNLGTLKRQKRENKMNQDLVLAMGRRPAPLPVFDSVSGGSKASGSPSTPRGVNLHSSDVGRSVENRLSTNSDSIYGNLHDLNYSPLSSTITTRKLPRKQKPSEAAQPSGAASLHSCRDKNTLRRSNGGPTPPQSSSSLLLSPSSSSSSSSLTASGKASLSEKGSRSSPGNVEMINGPNHLTSSFSINYNEELKNRVSMRADVH